MALTSDISFIVLAVSIALYIYFKKVYGYWKDRNVPTLPIWPFIGSQMDVLSMRMHQTVINSDIYNRYPNEKIVGGFRGTVPEMLVRDPEIIRSILVKDFNHFVNRHFHGSNSFFAQNLFTLQGEKWRMLRQKLTPTFTSSKMKQMFPLIVECGETLQEHLAKTLIESDVREMREIVAKFTTDTIGSCAFGLQMQSMTDDDAPFRRIGRDFFKPSKLRVVLEFLYFAYPNIAKLLPLGLFRKKPSDMEVFIVSIVKQIIQSRSETPSKRQDFMNLMIELRTQGYIAGDKANGDDLLKENLKFTDELMAAQAFVFFIAGFETSSNVMSFALRELAINPKVQDKLSEEINTVLEKHNGKVTYDAVQEMAYLEMVLNETLRKYPPLAYLTRKCNSTYTIPKTDIVIDKGVIAMIPTSALHYDPQYFPEPEKFMPERFAVEAEKTYHPFAYLPFGDGPRNCIGLRFGKLQAAIGLISILAKYSVALCDKTSKTICFEPTNVVSMPINGNWLKIKKR